MIRHLVFSILVISGSAWGAPEQQFAVIGDLQLESGELLHDVRVGYMAAGHLNSDRSNVIVFPTWFTGTAAHLFDFGVIGPGKLGDTDRYFFIAIDSLGNGVSTSPSNSKRQPGAEFPAITIGDMVNSQYRLLKDHLGIGKVYAVMGISMGGMQTFDWIGRYPKFMEHAVAIDGSPKATSYDLLQWQVHKDVIEVMREGGHDDRKIFELVGKVSQLTLRTPSWFVENVPPGEIQEFMDADTSVFNSYDYVAQLGAMMVQNVFGESDQTRQAWLESIVADVLVLGGARDHMVNQVPARKLAEAIGAEVMMNDSFCGHLGSSCEGAATGARVGEFLNE